MNSNTIEDFAVALEQKGVQVSRNVLGSTLTTYRIGGSIDVCVHISNIKDIEAIRSVIDHDFIGQLTTDNVVTIGKGSNLLVADTGFRGCAFILEYELATLLIKDKIDDDNFLVTVGGAMALPTFARQCSADGVSGLEFYVGIPGSVGGAVAMNAGGHGKQTSDVLESCETLNLKTGIVEKFSNNSCDFSYRHSRFSNTDIVFSATYRARQASAEKSKELIDEIVSWRRQNQPGGRNVGSVFQNPQDSSAGALIEQVGLKGFSIGGAQVSLKHANFIQAEQNASAADVLALIRHIQSTVKDATGHELQTEVRYIGKYEDG